MEMGVKPADIAREPSAIKSQYIECLAARYRLVRRAYAVDCVQFRAAQRIQKIYLGHLEKGRFVMVLKALKVQRITRGLLGRRKYAAAQRARANQRATLLQNAFRKHAASRDYRATLRAAKQVQRLERGRIGRSAFKKEQSIWLRLELPLQLQE